VTTVAATPPTARSGNIQTNNHRREVGPLQASTPGPLQVATTSGGSDVRRAADGLRFGRLTLLPGSPRSRCISRAGSGVALTRSAHLLPFGGLAGRPEERSSARQVARPGAGHRNVAICCTQHMATERSPDPWPNRPERHLTSGVGPTPRPPGPDRGHRFDAIGIAVGACRGVPFPRMQSSSAGAVSGAAPLWLVTGRSPRQRRRKPHFVACDRAFRTSGEAKARQHTGAEPLPSSRHNTVARSWLRGARARD
jgi:hypothetical protein